MSFFRVSLLGIAACAVEAAQASTYTCLGLMQEDEEEDEEEEEDDEEEDEEEEDVEDMIPGGEAPRVIQVTGPEAEKAGKRKAADEAKQGGAATKR